MQSEFILTMDKIAEDLYPEILERSTITRMD